MTLSVVGARVLRPVACQPSTRSHATSPRPCRTPRTVVCSSTQPALLSRYVGLCPTLACERCGVRVMHLLCTYKKDTQVELRAAPPTVREMGRLLGGGRHVWCGSV
jgi:hypothetical protein